MDYRLGIYSLEPEFIYLPPCVVLLLLFILSFLLRSDTSHFTQRHHSFPALGLTSFIGGFLFLVFYLYQVRPGFTFPVLGALAIVLVGIWLTARLLYPPPKQKPRRIKSKNRFNQQDMIPIDELELVEMGVIDNSQQEP